MDADIDLDLDQAYRQCTELVTREILGETIVVPITGDLACMDDIFSLNETGAFIWGRLDGETRLAAIRDGLTERFDVGRDEAESDLRALIQELAEARLVERAA